jgi:tetratricopeptide (TPR) repeat protein
MDTLASAITLNPYMERYRMDYSQIALALVREIVKKQELSDADRQDITTLVQVAIGEAKAAVAINSTSSVTWANLARVYQAIMPIVQGADSWAIASFQQAINLDPVNPILRLGLGGVYYSLSRWDQAIRSFELAVAAKPDLANAHYNLALALREAGKLEEAADSMRQTIALLNAGTPDYDKAKKELEDLEAKIKTKKESEKAKKETGSEQAPAVTPGQGEQPPLEKPTVQKEPIVKPPINLPQGSEPPKQ